MCVTPSGTVAGFELSQPATILNLNAELSLRFLDMTAESVYELKDVEEIRIPH